MENESELLQSEPFALADLSPRNISAGLKGLGWSEARHLFPNRKGDPLISKKCVFF